MADLQSRPRTESPARSTACQQKQILQQGMTLVELLVALGVFLVLLALVVPSLLQLTTTNTRNEQVGTAVRLATTTLENYRAQLGSATVPSTGTAVLTSVDRGQTYTLNVSFCPSDMPSNITCSTSSRYIRVVVTNGTGPGAINLYTAESYFTQLD